MRDLDGCYGFESKHCHPRLPGVPSTGSGRGSSFNSSFFLDPRLRPRGLVEDDNVLGSVMNIDNIDNQGLMNHV
jgi:hypothetical protein